MAPIYCPTQVWLALSYPLIYPPIGYRDLIWVSTSTSNLQRLTHDHPSKNELHDLLLALGMVLIVAS